MTSVEIKIINFHSRSIRELPNVSRLETSWEEASPEYWTESGPGKRMFLNARDGKFPGFFPEKSSSQEMAFGNADL